MAKVWLVRVWNAVEPEVMAGPFQDTVPDEYIISALQEDDAQDDDVLFQVVLNDDGSLGTRAYSGGFMDGLREKAQAGPTR